MALKQAVRDRILTDVIKSVKGDGWKVLIVDKMSTRMISSCCKMSEIMSEGITLVEDINKKREPLPTLDAVYLITPIKESVDRLMTDFDVRDKALYRQAHIFFTEACAEELFKTLCKAPVAKFIKTLKEINIAFLAYETQVYSLDCSAGFQYFYSSKYKVEERILKLERYAEQIATLCSALGEYPTVRYRSECSKNLEFAQLVQQKLDAYRADDHNMGQGPGKDQSKLLILDRGFDPVTPLLHELTLQAMCYDLLAQETPITDPADMSSYICNDVYSFQSSANDTAKRDCLLSENDKLWEELRHQHIAVVSQLVPKKLREFGESKKMTVQEKPSMKDLSQMIKKMPQYQKELNNYSMHLRLASDCMDAYKARKIDNLCKIEQNLAMGTDHEGEKIKDHVRLVSSAIVDSSVSLLDKCRIILLYLIQVGGTTDENLQKLLERAGVGPDNAAIIHNIQTLGVNLLPDGARGNRPAQLFQPQHRPERGLDASVYQTSRWIPYIKDLMNEVVEDKLDVRRFPHLQESRSMNISGSAPVSARYGQWYNKDRGGQAPSRMGPRLIIFIIGGVSFSELRCAYEVTAASKNWEVIIGSTHILTPESFLTGLKTLNTG